MARYRIVEVSELDRLAESCECSRQHALELAVDLYAEALRQTKNGRGVKFVPVDSDGVELTQ
jgi:hypothetical protein